MENTLLKEKISSETKILEIDFGGQVLAKISICENCITVNAAINGYGDAILKEDILINPLN